MNEVDEKTVAVVDVVSEGAHFLYEYDVGDSWRHEVVVESIKPAKPVLKYAICFEGQLAFPPEDSGGTWAYSSMLEALADSSHEEHEDFDPEAFDLAGVNTTLERVR